MAFQYAKALYIFLGLLTALAYTNCSKSSPIDGSPAPVDLPNAPTNLTCFEQLGSNTEWSGLMEIPIVGYSGNAMEPQISADGVVLLFNNKTTADTEMNVHFAVKQNNGSFVYGGELGGANNPGVLDGVPATDSANNFYFVSLRSYGAGSPARYRSLFGAQFSTAGGGLSLINVAPADSGFPEGTAPSGSSFYVDMDLGVSWDGSKALVARTKFSDGKGYPDYSRLELFNVNDATRSLTTDTASEAILKNINLEACKIYAPTISSDQKELYYSVMSVGADSTFDFKLVVAKRAIASEPFGKGSIITAVSGTLEGPSISYHDGGKTLYFHKLDTTSGKFKL